MEKKVVKVSTEKKKVVVRPKEENFEVDQEHSLDVYLSQNNDNVKISLDWKNIGIVVVCIIVLICSSFLIISYLDNYEEKSKNTTTTKNPYEVITTESTTEAVIYETTTRVQTQATHTVFDRNR